MLDHLWQSTLFAGGAGLLTLALRRNRAQTRYWVWLAASAKFLLPMALLVAAGSHLGWRRTSPPVAPPSFAVAIAQVSQPFTVETSAAARPINPAAPGPPAKIKLIPELLTIAWACGFAAIGLRWWIRWRQVSAAVRQAARIALPIGIEVRSSLAMLEPGVFGVLRPVLLLPEGITESLTPEQLRAIVAHEMCHVRRRDNLATSFHMLVEALFWFHPLVWWIGARLVEERERACDEEVVREGSNAQTYAESILKVCEFYLASPLECVSGVSGANLKRRIEEIMNHRMVQRLNRGKQALLAGAGMLAVAAPVLVGMLNTPRIQAQSTLSSLTGDQSTSTGAEADIMRVEEAWRLAKLHRDIAALDRIMADVGFNETNQNGNSRNKAQTLELWKSFSIGSLTTDTSEVRVNGDTATVLGTQTEDGSERMLFTRVYVKNANGWQLLTSMQFRNPKIAATTTPSSVSPNQPLPVPGPEAEVLKVDEAYRLAKLHQDVAALDRIMDDGYNETNQNGNTYNKERALALWKTFHIDSLTTDTYNVRVNGNTATVSGTQTEGNNEFADHMLFTRVYVKHSDGWQLLTGMQFRNPNAAAPAATSSVSPSQTPKLSGPELEVMKADEAYRLAKWHQDIAALDRIIADEGFNETNQNGNSRNKAQTLALWKTFRVESLYTDSASVRVAGDTATVTGTQTEDGTEHMLFNRVYVKHADGWRLLTSIQFRNPNAPSGQFAVLH